MKKSNLLFYIAILTAIAPLVIFAVDTESSVAAVLLINALTKNGLILMAISSLGLTLIYLAYRRIYTDSDIASHVRISTTDRMVHLLSLAVATDSLIATLSYVNLLENSSFVGNGVLITVIILYLSGFLYETTYYSKNRSKSIVDKFDESSNAVSPALGGTYAVFFIFMIGLSYFAPGAMSLARISATLIIWQVFHIFFIRKYLTRALLAR